MGLERLGEDPTVGTKGLAGAAVIVALEDREQSTERLPRGTGPLVLERQPVHRGRGTFRTGRRPRAVVLRPSRWRSTTAANRSTARRTFSSGHGSRRTREAANLSKLSSAASIAASSRSGKAPGGIARRSVVVP